MWGKRSLLLNSVPSIFDLDFQPSATAGCGWLAVGTRRSIGVMWLAPQCPDGSKQKAPMAKVAGGMASYFQSNFNLRDQAGEVSSDIPKIALFGHYQHTHWLLTSI